VDSSEAAPRHTSARGVDRTAQRFAPQAAPRIARRDITKKGTRAPLRAGCVSDLRQIACWRVARSWDVHTVHQNYTSARVPPSTLRFACSEAEVTKRDLLAPGRDNCAPEVATALAVGSVEAEFRTRAKSGTLPRRRPASPNLCAVIEQGRRLSVAQHPTGPVIGNINADLVRTHGGRIEDRGDGRTRNACLGPLLASPYDGRLLVRPRTRICELAVTEPTKLPVPGGVARIWQERSCAQADHSRAVSR